MALTDQQKLFVEHYADCLNASEAARRAGYSHDTAGQQGYRLYHNRSVQAAIRRKLNVHMSANEVLNRLGSIARADVTDFWQINDMGHPYFDFQACKAAGMLHLVKKVNFKDGEVTSVEFWDVQDALVQLGRKHKLFADGVKIEANGKTIVINSIEAVEPPPLSEDDDD